MRDRPNDFVLSQLKEYLVVRDGKLTFIKDNRKRKVGDTVTNYSNNTRGRFRFFKESFSCSRVAYYLQTNVWPEGFVVDHIDGDISNDSLSNLRLVTNEENLRSYRKTKTNKTSVYRGVNLYKRKGQSKTYWVGRYCEGKSHIVLGYFVCEKEAAMAWDRMARSRGRCESAMNFPAYMKEKLL